MTTITHKILLAFMGLVLALVSSEFIVRFSGLAPRYYFFHVKGADATFRLSNNEILGYEMIPNVRSSTYDCHNSFPFTNSLGFRDIERSIERPSNIHQRIILLGDSVVAGHGMCDTDQILSRQLERNAAGNLEVFNFGVGGYCTRAEVELLEERAFQFHPDKVILLFVENDYVNSNGTIINSLSKSTFAPIREKLFSISAFARLVSTQAQISIFNDPLRENAIAVGADNVEKGLARLAELAKEYKFSPLIVTWPYFDDTRILEPTQQYTSKKIPTKSVQQIARELSLPILELAPLFRTDFEQRKLTHKKKNKASPRWIYTQGDGTHPNELGNKLAAEFMEQVLTGS